jgi:hypothetical protein
VTTNENETLGCLRSDQMVLRADGSTIRADAVRKGMALAGEFGPVEDALDSVDELPTSNEFYEVTHSDGSSYVVTGDAENMHLVTVRYCRRMKLQTVQNKYTTSMCLSHVFDVKGGQAHSFYGLRTYRVHRESGLVARYPSRRHAGTGTRQGGEVRQ